MFPSVHRSPACSPPHSRKVTGEQALHAFPFPPAAHTSTERARGPDHGEGGVMLLLVLLGQVCLLHTGIMGWTVSPPKFKSRGLTPRTSAGPVSGD